MQQKSFAAIIGIFFMMAACQSPDNTQTEQTASNEVLTETASTQTRPKPEYYNFKGIERRRVYLCMDPTEDTFHKKHDCPVLVECKSTFRNLILARAIEDFDRYNCETCSADLGYIFDENFAQ